MANPKDLASSDMYNPMETPPAPSDEATSATKKCYAIYLFAMTWAPTNLFRHPAPNPLGFIRDLVITDIAKSTGLWEWVVRSFGGVPSFSGQMTSVCECMASGDTLNPSDLINKLKTHLPSRGKIISVFGTKSYFDWEVRHSPCKCKNPMTYYEKCKGPTLEVTFEDSDGNPISDTSRSYTDSAGNKQDLGGTSTTRAQKLKKIGESERKAFFTSYRCCKNWEEIWRGSTFSQKKGTQLSTVITNLLDDN